jgi:hypothetical protein
MEQRPNADMRRQENINDPLGLIFGEDVPGRDRRGLVKEQEREIRGWPDKAGHDDGGTAGG